MYKEFYASSDLMTWPLIGLGLFFVAFLGVLVYVFIGLRDSRTIDRMAAMPLDDDVGGARVREVEDHV